MANIKINMFHLFKKTLTDQDLFEQFELVINCVSNEEYQINLRELFAFGVRSDFENYTEGKLNPNNSIFTTISVASLEDAKQTAQEYIQKWCTKYVRDRLNSSLLSPLKNYGERDSALLERVAAATKQPDSILEHYIVGHFLYMSAENKNGAILEEYLAEVLEPYGWYWCAGATFRAIDFCYLSDERNVLLQVKNKYNTENSSSSAIRNDTEIIKWNRLNRPIRSSGLDNPITNWPKLSELVGADDHLSQLLTEEKYLEYIRNNSTQELDTLD